MILTYHVVVVFVNDDEWPGALEIFLTSLLCIAWLRARLTKTFIIIFFMEIFVPNFQVLVAWLASGLVAISRLAHSTHDSFHWPAYQNLWKCAIFWRMVMIVRRALEGPFVHIIHNDPTMIELTVSLALSLQAPTSNLEKYKTLGCPILA